MKIHVKKLFSKINKNWLLNNYPFPSKFTFILNDWLNNKIEYQDILRFSLTNYTLNGLEKTILLNQTTFFNTKNFSRNNKKINKKLIRYMNDVILITNNRKFAIFIKKKIENFLLIRGLKTSITKDFLLLWKNKTKFEYLGFTFHYVINQKITTQKQKRLSNLKCDEKLYKINIQ